MRNKSFNFLLQNAAVKHYLIEGNRMREVKRMCKDNQSHEHDDTLFHSTGRISDESGVDPQLLTLLEQVCESGEDALPRLKSYMEETQVETGGSAHPDAESALKAFKEQHAAAFAAHKHTRSRRWGYRLCVVAAAIIVLNTLCVFAFGSNMFSMIAKWGDETFSFRSDFKNDNVGGIIYEDRSDGDTEPDDYKDAASVTGDGSAFYSYQESDTTAIGIEKSESKWDESGSIETFYVMNMNIVDAVKAYGINEKLFPTWVPNGFTQDYVKVTRDYFYNQIDFTANYLHEDGTREFAVKSFTLVEGEDGGTTEKDERPVEIYTVHGVDWYIMHNLSRVNAVAMLGNREILFWGDISVDEMKQIIDSVYEVE